MYVMVHPCVLQDIGPLGPLPKKGKELASIISGILLKAVPLKSGLPRVQSQSGKSKKLTFLNATSQ